MEILQFTDTHLYGDAAGRLRGVQTDASLRCVLEEAYAHAPNHEAILVTGDLVQDDPTGYLRFRSLFGNSHKPVLCIPGNHDEPAAMRRVLTGAPFEICGSHLIGAWQFVMLDSYHAGHVGGLLSTNELARLDAALAQSAVPAFISLHHQPVPMDSLWLDDIGLANADEFWRVIEAHPQVRGVAWGHVHQNYDAYRGEVRLLATPSTGAQFMPHSDRFAIDPRPPAYRRLELHADGRIDTEVVWVRATALPQAAAR